VRFNEQKQAAEDAEFTMKVCRPDARVAVITNYLYFYRTYTPNSLTKRYLTGDLETKRIVYHYDTITEDREDLLEEIKQVNQKHEVYVLTNRCDLPELSQYAKVMRPCKVRGMELRGEPFDQFTKILPPPDFDIIIYTSQKDINGIFTWIYSFCSQMNGYDICVLHEGMKQEMISRLSAVTYVKHNGDPVKCKTLMMMKISDSIPDTIRYGHSIQILHSPKLSDLWEIPKDRDEVIPVSEVVRESWGIKAKPIHNMTSRNINTLSLISATRLSTKEKGLDRMKVLCASLKAAGINFEWDLYGDFDPGINGITYRGQTIDIRKKIRAADYLVQLSDAEGFCYSIVEALEEGTPIITTPIKILDELGIKDKVHGHIIPFDMQFDIKEILSIPPVKYLFDNEKSIKSWEKILGKGEGHGSMTIQCTSRYRDMILGRYVEPGEIITLNSRRASEVITSGYARRT
jgi:glycosyltransferase involved in cell wall biosynthesis